jgi:hypothetical protein
MAVRLKLDGVAARRFAVFDKNGKPLTPPEGITFDGKLGLMQGIIVAPSGDVWVLGVDLTKGRIVCEGDSAEPCKSFLGPFQTSAADFLTKTMSEQKGDAGSVTLLKTGRHPISELSVQGRRSSGAVGGGSGWQRQRLDFQLRHA